MNLLHRVLLPRPRRVTASASPTTDRRRRSSSVSECITPADQAQRPCTSSDPVAPAAAAGLQTGDEIVRFDGRPVSSWADVQTEIRAEHRHARPRRRPAGGAASVPLHHDPAVTQRPKLDDERRSRARRRRQDRARAWASSASRPPGNAAAVRRPPSPGWSATRSSRPRPWCSLIPQKMVGRRPFAARPAPNATRTGPISLVGIGRIAGEFASADAVRRWPSQGRQRCSLADRGAQHRAVRLQHDPAAAAGRRARRRRPRGRRLRRGVARLRGRPDPGPVDIARAAAPRVRGRERR